MIRLAAKEVHHRLSRRAVHHIAGDGYDCGVTEVHVQSRGAGASSDWARVSCVDCLNARPS